MQTKLTVFPIACFVALSALTAGCANNSQDAIKEKRKEEMTNKENRVSPPSTATNTIGENTITVTYSAPGVKGRAIWGSLVPYNEIWRTGANEATTISFTQDVTIMGQPLSKDIYSLFTIPTDSVWTVIFNYNETQWGAFKYDQSEDALRVQATPVMVNDVTENLTFTVMPDPAINGGVIRMNWEKLQLDIPFTNAATK